MRPILAATVAASLATLPLLAGCVSDKRVATAEAGVEACKARHYKLAVDHVRCLNEAAMVARPVAGNSRDLFDVAMAKRMVLAEKIDRGEISKAEADLAMVQTMAALNSEEQGRAALAAARRGRSCTSNIVAGTLITNCD